MIRLKSDTEQLLQELSQKLEVAFKANNISTDNEEENSARDNGEENSASGPSVGLTPTKRLLQDVQESTPKQRQDLMLLNSKDFLRLLLLTVQ